jgi:HNH endonuclease/NUMOD4 motif
MTNSIQGASLLLLEYWKPISALDNAFEVSCTGKIRRIGDSKVIKQGLNAEGYPRVWPWHNKRTVFLNVHQVVAAAFLGTVPVGYEVDHLDANRSKPWLSNLEYVTHEENMQRVKSRCGFAKGVQMPQSILIEDDVAHIKKELRRYFSHIAVVGLAEQFKVSVSTIYLIHYGKSWKHVA